MAAGLPWVRIDSDLAQNPKVLDLVAEYGQRGMAAAFMFICSIGYSAAHNTDGSIRKAALASIHGTPALARLLVEVGLWDVFEKGWVIARYAEHQPTMAMRAEIEKAKSEAGRKAANARWNNDAN